MWKIIAALYIAITALPSTSDAPSRFHLSTDKASCRECHADILGKSVKHFPDLEGDCVFCHEPENLADGTIVIRTYGEMMCRGCHTDAERYAGGPHAGLGCTDCHTVHTSDNEHLLASGPLELCAKSCHNDETLGRSHPIGENVIDVNTGSAMTCISTCHKLHNLKSQDLLLVETPQLCKNCHDDKF